MDIYRIGNKLRAPKEVMSAREISIESLDENKNLIVMDIREFKDFALKAKFPQNTIEQSKDGKQYPTAEFYDGLLFMTLNDINWSVSGTQLIPREINIFLGRNNLVVVYHKMTESLERIINKLDHSDLYKCLYELIDYLLDNDRRIINEVENMALKVEDKILKNFHVDDSKKDQKYMPADQYMDQIVKLRKHLMVLKTYLEPTADVIEILEADESDLISDKYDKYFMKLSLKADRIINQLTSLRDYIAQVRESWQAHVDLAFNKTMKFFTVITTVFAPLTLLTGWYGMNFERMPELKFKYSYPIVFLVAILITLLCIRWFKKKHWL